MVDENAELEVRGNENAFVSRGGKKIEKALNYFNIDPTDLVVMDVGASTGGFTDCLLRRACAQGVFHWTWATVSWRGVCGRIRVCQVHGAQPISAM